MSILRNIMQPLIYPAMRGILSGDRRLSGSAPAWTPAELFANGEQGVWLDESDLSTMFQDLAGTVPAVVDSPVGKRLDKSKGLALGPELVTNGALTSSTGWTDTGVATVSFSAAGARITSPENGVALLSQTYAGAVGVYYEVTADVLMHATPPSPASVGINIGGSGENYFVNTQRELVAGNTYRIRGVARLTNATTFVLRIGEGSGLNYALDFTIKNLSVREIAGNHWTATNSSARPVLRLTAGKYSLEWDGVDDGGATATIDFTATDKMTVVGGFTPLTTSLNTIIGAANALFIVNNAWGGGLDQRISGTTGSPSVIGRIVTIGSPLVYANSLSTTGATALDNIKMRINAAVEPLAVAVPDPAGGGNFLAGPVGLGVSGGNWALLGHTYQEIVRGAASTLAEIEAAETYVNAKTGAY